MNKAVSYTHLDVYKRQIPAELSCNVCVRAIRYPVSYTHLDVYKRQVKISAKLP